MRAARRGAAACCAIVCHSARRAGRRTCRRRRRCGPSAASGAARLAIFVHPLRHAPAEDVARSIGALFGIGEGGVGGGRGAAALADGRAARPGHRPTAAGECTAVPDTRGRYRRSPPSLCGPVAIFPDQRTNSLLIRATPADYQPLCGRHHPAGHAAAAGAHRGGDRRGAARPAVRPGVDFRVPDQRGDGSGVVIGGELAGGVGGGRGAARAAAGGGGCQRRPARALGLGHVSILSRPVILAQNNEEARIMVGDQRPFIQISRALPTDNAARDQVIQYRDVGTQLTIRPTINPDGYVTLTVLQEVSSATDVTQFGAPVISTREAETRLLVKDGHTVVIGGLIDQRADAAPQSGIPLLHGHPAAGQPVPQHHAADEHERALPLPHPARAVQTTKRWTRPRSACASARRGWTARCPTASRSTGTRGGPSRSAPPAARARRRGRCGGRRSRRASP